MTNNKRIYIAAVILGLITVITLNYYLKTLDKPAFADIPHTEVVVAVNTIPEHTRITADMLQLESLPSEAIHPEAILSLSDAVDGISRTDIIKGEQVLASRVTSEDRRASLSYRVPEGMRAISIPVNEVSGVAGYISAGDKVDIMVSYLIGETKDTDTDTESQEEHTVVYTVLQNVTVLAAGAFTQQRDDEESQMVGTITLAVGPEQAEVLAFAFRMGVFHLTLRSPLDETRVNLDSYGTHNFETFRER
ncbi:Flp pilus assembly protein CpaB [Candidatus Contubernalis alkaliaceticus]|uniref:Flp pilus assembly protein CpaB n=1 Tax=Candidatus Contubernalis alkaliaceticus TaxID=338645 RepID=UPI001F4BCEB0|nr:Flp pilus assembly protein CpaB [Candidatus Contubernalis alkalaceticus]UNC93454.1 Flp pilus assembly protein CpaB [Candidatus Contubernalis alkalaceticus]